MKLLFTLLRQFGRRMCELLFCIFCMGLFSSQSDAQTVPKKKGVLRSLSNSLPYGYTQLGNSTLYYKQNSESIDLIGQFSELYYSSTYGDYGYSSAMKVDDNRAININSLDGTISDGVTVKITLEEYNGLAQFNYVVTNANDTEKKFSLGSRADVMIGNNDRAPITRKNYLDGTTYGLQMAYDHSEFTSSLVLLLGSGMDGVVPVDNYWFGYYYLNSDLEQVVGNYVETGDNLYEENGSYDSGLGWCWENKVLPPNSTTVYSVLIGVGDVTLLPMVQNLDISAKDTIQWNDVSRSRQYTLSGTYFSPAAHKGVIYYSIDNGTWIQLTDSLASETEINKTFTVSFASGLPVHTIRVCAKDQAGAYSPFYTTSYKEVSSLLVNGLEEVEYTGKPITLPSLVFRDPQSSVTLEPDKQYTYYYSDNVNAGQASIHVQGVYPYSIGENIVSFNILPTTLSGNLTLPVTNFVYTGAEITPTVQYVDDKYADLKENIDYIFVYTNNKYPGTATVTLKGCGNYKGEVSASFEIVKKEVEKADLTIKDFSGVFYYDGNPHPIVFDALEGLGAYTVYYVDKQGNRSTEAPTAAGDYNVSVVFEEGDCFKAASIENVLSFSIRMMSTIKNTIPENNALLSSSTVVFSWQGDELTKSYDIYLWKEGDPEPSKPVVSNLQAIRYQNSSFCDYDNRYCWKVEGYDGNRKLNSQSEISTFTIRPTANLHVTGIECGEAWAGQTLNVSWTVKNDGKESTGEATWKDCIWLVSDLSGGISDSPLKNLSNIKALSSGEFYSNTTELQIDERIAGDYYVVVAADIDWMNTIDWSPAGNVIPDPYTPSLTGTPYPYLTASFWGGNVVEAGEEKGWSDNFFYKKISIQVPNLPDLQVLSVIPPDNSLSGQSVMVAATIVNKGGAATKADASWYDEIFISPTNVFDETTAKSLDKIYHQGGLGKNEQYTVPFEVTVPAGFSGDYYFFVKTNTYNEVYEHALSENNMTVSEKTLHVIASPTSDIQAISVTLPSGGGSAAPLAIQGKGKNVGLMDTDVSYWTDYVFASRNGEALDASAKKIGEIQHYGFVKRGEEYDISGSVSCLDLTDGDYYIYIKVNGDGRVADSDLGNNVIRSASTLKVEHADLTVTNVTIPEVLNAGCRYPISWTIQNNGADVEHFTVSDLIQFSDLNGMEISNVTASHTLSLKKGASTTYETQLYVPVLPDNTKYQLSVKVNNDGLLPEKSIINNTSTAMTIQYTRYKTDENGNPIMDEQGNPIVTPIQDLSLLSVFAPTSLLTTSTDFKVSWGVENLGEEACSSWTTSIYLEDNGRVLLETIQGTSLEIGGLYKGETTLSIPDKYAAATHLIFETKIGEYVSDANSADNMLRVPILVKSAPLPDLRIKNMQITALVAGQNATLTYEVENKGAGDTRIEEWTDQVYLTGANSLTDAISGKQVREKLASGDSYKGSITFKVPSEYVGNYNLFLKVDQNDLLYEGEEKGNNVMQAFVSVLSPGSISTDLTVKEVTAPSSYTVGDEVSLSWTIQNGDLYAAVGDLKDAVYLSKDEEWDVSDMLVGTVSGSVSIQPGESVKRTATGIINSVTPGSYYVIIRTNQLNAIKETDYTNNAATAAVVCKVDFHDLAVGSSVTVDGQGFFKLTAEPGESLLLHLEADGTEKGFSLFTAHDKVATVTEYDYSSAQPNNPYQEILIAEMKQGSYYILAQQQEFVSGVESNFTLGGDRPEVERKRMTLSSQLLQFGISRMDKPEGGNGGSVTSAVMGAKFDSIMDYRLKRDGKLLPAEAVYFQNTSEALVTFNLNELATGTYDVVIEKNGGVKKEMKSGYTVVQDSPNKLLTKIVASSSVRFSTTNPITVEYANDGLSDVVVSELLLVSENGHPIGLTAKEAGKGETELHLPIVEPGTNKPASIAPGGKGSFTIFTHANSMESISLQLYIIK